MASSRWLNSWDCATNLIACGVAMPCVLFVGLALGWTVGKGGEWRWVRQRLILSLDSEHHQLSERLAQIVPLAWLIIAFVVVLCAVLSVSVIVIGVADLRRGQTGRSSRSHAADG